MRVLEKKTRVMAFNLEVPAELSVEDLAFAIAAEPPRAFLDFLEKIASRLSLPDTSHQILELFSNIDLKAHKVAQAIQANQYYESQLIQHLESISKREHDGSVEGAVVLLGMENTRNLITALQLVRTLDGGKLVLSPSSTLKYALKTEEILARQKHPYPETAFAAGFAFDALALICSEVAYDKKKVSAYIDVVYNHGLKAAKIGDKIAHELHDFEYRKFAFAVCLLHDIGKIALAAVEPRYLSFVDECIKKEIPRQARYYAERRRFGIDHSALGAMCCEYLRIFSNIASRAIFYHHEPYLLSGGRSQLAQLASVVSLSSNVANYFKKVRTVDDPAVAVWMGPELSRFQMDRADLIEAIRQVDF